MQCVTLPRITELNPHLLCVLCGGYYIDATSIIECLHAFCKSCIVHYLETHKYCPICDVLVHKTEPLQNIRPDVIRQSIVYKLVPNLYKKEMRNRRNFYVQVNPQLHPACTESKGQITEASRFFSMDDLINLSLEYVNSIDEKNIFFVSKGSKRYFRCRAAVTIKSLRRLLSAKYALGVEHKIHLFLNGIQLPDHLKLLDVAYISSWKRVGYICILYEILTVDCSPTNVEKSDLSARLDPIKSEFKNQIENQISECIKSVEIDNSDSASFGRPAEVEISKVLPLCNSHINVDLNSNCSNVTNVNSIIQPQNYEKFVGLEPKNHSSAAPSLKPNQNPSNEKVAPSTYVNISLLSNCKINSNLTDETKSPQCSDLKNANKNGDDILKASSRVDANSSSTKQVSETNVGVHVDEVKTTELLHARPSTAFNKDNASKSTPPQIMAKKDANNAKGSRKKDGRNVRSECLPPVPPLRMIVQSPKYSSAKSSNAAAAVRTNLAVSIPRLTKLQPTVAQLANHTTAKATHPPLSVRHSVPKATDLISLYSKSPARHTAGSSLKKSSSSVSILRIDPKTLSPIESCSASSTNVSTAIVPAGLAGTSRKMLPGRSTLSAGAYANSVYSCANTAPLHLTAPSAFGKLPPAAAQLYPPPYPTFEHSSLYPMNELVRRMFPSFNFGSLDPSKTPLDPSVRSPPPYPQSIPTAVSHFLTTSAAAATKPNLVRQGRYEKSRRKAVPSVTNAQLTPSVNGGDAAASSYEKRSALKADTERCGKRTNVAAANGQIKSSGAVKRKNFALSDFSINNLLPVCDVKRPPTIAQHSHACTADGVNQVCDQAQAQPVSASNKNESR